ARVVDHEPAAAACLARLREGEAAEVAAALAGALTGRTDPGHCPCLGAGPPAHLARPFAGEPERDRCPVDRVAERQRSLRLDVRAAPRPGLSAGRAAGATEDAAEQVT